MTDPATIMNAIQQGALYLMQMIPDPTIATDPGGGVMEWAKLGATGLMFIVWWATFKLFSKQQEKMMQSHNEIVENRTNQMADAYKNSLESYREQNQILQTLVKDQQENTSHMIQVLTQIKEKLNQPVKCPIVEADKIKSHK